MLPSNVVQFSNSSQPWHMSFVIFKAKAEFDVGGNGDCLGLHTTNSRKEMKELLKHNEQISVVVKLSTMIFDMLPLKRFAENHLG